MVIGLTGLYCAGKNYIGALLEKRGIPVLDADRLGHEVIDSETESIISQFGQTILDSSGKINRQLLGKLVFNRPGAMAVLESLVHPGVNRLTEEWIAKCNESREAGICVLNAAVLHKSSVFSQLSAIIEVKAPFFIRFFRAIGRDKRPLGEILNRFKAQKGFPGYKNQQPSTQLFFPCADIYTIRNSGFSGSQRILEKRIQAILEGLTAYGKEEIIAGRCNGRGVSGNRVCSRDSNF